MWIFYRIINFIKRIPKEIKWFFQRGKRGWADIDVICMDYWFFRTVIPMLKKLKDTKHGYPVDMTEEEWDEKLNKMIRCFEEANEDTCSIKNEYDEEFGTFWDKVIDNPKTNNSIEYLEISDKWRKRNDEIYDYRNKMKNEAFKLFSEYFWSLWD